MENIAQINYLEIQENKEYNKLATSVIKECFQMEDIKNANLYVSIILTNNENIKKINNEYRNIDKETDVLSFPMFEQEEVESIINKNDNKEEVLGDIIISIPKVEEQSKEYGHGFEREFAYMLVHGFYHLMGHDHMEEEEKKQMRDKEEKVLERLNMQRDI